MIRKTKANGSGGEIHSPVLTTAKLALCLGSLMWLSACEDEEWQTTTSELPDNVPHINGDGDEARMADVTDWDDPKFTEYDRAFAYVESLIIDNPPGEPEEISVCSGIAIFDYHVLTAAHCVEDTSHSIP